MIDVLEMLRQQLAEGGSSGFDYSRGDVVLDQSGDVMEAGRGMLGAGPIQRNWTGPRPARPWHPISPYTNPFQTPEYGIQNSPANPIISDRPPEIPPTWSKSRGEHSRYPGLRPISAGGKPGDEWLMQNAPFPTQARPGVPPPQWTDKVPILDPGELENYGPGSPFGRQPPPPELLAQMRQWWDATQVQPQAMASPYSSALNQLMRRLPYGQY